MQSSKIERDKSAFSNIPANYCCNNFKFEMYKVEKDYYKALELQFGSIKTLSDTFLKYRDTEEGPCLSGTG